MRRLLRPTAWPIAIKLSVTLLIMALVPALGVSYFALQEGLGRLAAAEYQNMELLAVATANRLDQLIADTARVTVQAAGDSEVADFLDGGARRDALRPSAQRTITNIKDANPDYAEVYLLDRDGTCLLSTKESMVGRNFAFRDYHRAALRGEPYVSGLLLGSVTQVTGLYFSHPVGRPARGVVVIKMLGRTIAEIVGGVRVGAEGYAALVDHDGLILSHPDPTMLHKSLTPLPAAAQARVAQERALLSGKVEDLGMYDLAGVVRGARAPGHTGYYSTNHRRHKIAGYAPLQQRPWVLVVTEPEEQFAAPFRSLARRVYAGMGVVALLALLLAVALGRGITRPVRALTLGAHQVMHGVLDDAKVAVRAQDELGTLAYAFNSMVQGLRERRREHEIFGRVLSPEVREKLLSGQLQLGGELRRVAVLFSDIRGFSGLAERAGPHELVSLLNEYLTEMTAAVAPFGGYVNNFIGDAIVVVFGAPADGGDIERRAACAALAMRERLAALNERRRARGEAALQAGIGVSTGVAVAGQIGSPERMQYTVIGDAVNVAARLEGLTKELPEYPILINAATAAPLQAELPLKDLGPRKVKGRSEPVEVFAVLGSSGPARSADRQVEVHAPVVEAVPVP